MYVRFPGKLKSLNRKRLVVVDSPTAIPPAGTGDSICVGGIAGANCSFADNQSPRTTAVVCGYFTSFPDTADPGTAPAEMLNKLYAERGQDAFAAVDGAFCCLVIDWNSDLVVFAVDKLGISRAYIGHSGDLVACSNSLKELSRVLPNKFDIDFDSVNEFLIFGWVPAPYSMFKQVAKLPPASFWCHKDGASRTGEYWDIQIHGHTLARTQNELTGEIRAYLDKAVERGVGLGGKWGSFLSGGMDSSSVVASLAITTDSTFPTYFGAFDAELNKYLTIPDEAKLAQSVADQCNSAHEIVYLDADAVDKMPEVVAALEEPVCDGGCLVVAEVLRSAKSAADGMMTGVGGDFLFGGERRHILINLLRHMRRLPRVTWSGVRKMFALLPLFRNARLSQLHFDYNRLYSLLDLEFDEMYARILEGTPVPISRLLCSDVHASLTREPVKRIQGLLAHTDGLDPLTQMLYLDLKLVIPNHCVREVQTLGDHFGIKTYNPYLDADFVDFSMTIPPGDKVRGMELKSSMKRAMRGRLPDSTMSRSKGGLGGPTRWWVIQERGLLRDALSAESIEHRGIFDSYAVTELKELTRSDTKDYSKLLWSLFTLELWMREFLDDAG